MLALESLPALSRTMAHILVLNGGNNAQHSQYRNVTSLFRVCLGRNEIFMLIIVHYIGPRCLSDSLLAIMSLIIVGTPLPIGPI